MPEYFLNPVDFWNINGTWQKSFNGLKSVTIDDDDCISLKAEGKDEPIQIKPDSLGFIKLPKASGVAALPKDTPLSKFMVYSQVQHKGNHKAAATFIECNYLNSDIPYIRVGCDYFKITTKPDRYGVKRKVLKGWKKDEIKQDHGPKLMNLIPLFDDFCIVPDNENYQAIIDNCYNLYSPFNHTPETKPITEAAIPNSLKLLRHLFGDQYKLGLKYMQCLYMHPTQPLPILCILSEDRGTGKTTFLNWLDMIFSDNYLLINPDDLTKDFNSHYANKNIIGVDETVIDRSHVVEKIKSLATAKSISVNPKFVQSFSIPSIAPSFKQKHQPISWFTPCPSLIYGFHLSYVRLTSETYIGLICSPVRI